MNRFDQRKITKNLISLRKAIQNDVNLIADKLYEQNVFSGEVRQEIRNLRSQNPQLQCGVLINYLLRSGKDAYCKFKNILEDMGQFEIVTAMEKSVHKGSAGNRNNWIEERETTFILSDPKVPERLNKPTTTAEEEETDIENGRCIESRIEEVHQLERMMTFVLSNLDGKDKNNNTVDFKKEFKQKLKEESNGNEELLGFFKTLRYNSFSLTSQSLAH